MKRLYLICIVAVSLIAGATSNLAARECSGAPCGLLTDLIAASEEDLVNSVHPRLSWIVPLNGNGTMQSAYRIVLTDRAGRKVWDSGKVRSAASTAVSIGGKGLEPDKAYEWKVRVWDNRGRRSAWSEFQHFRTSTCLDDTPAELRLVTDIEKPDDCIKEGDIYFADFGKAAFARIKLTVSAQADSFTVRLGEARIGNRVNREPGGSIRYCSYTLPLEKGVSGEYLIEFVPDKRNTDATGKYNESDVRPVLMPDYIGEVFPFRYCEVEVRGGGKVEAERYSVHYPFDGEASAFKSDNEILNQVWELCKYSIKATSFCGKYVDGDRERIAYEADAMINQLAHYGVDREYSMARSTADYLLDNPTWPTEWCLQMLIIAWNDYMYTGDSRLLERRYELLKSKTLMALRDGSGFISTRTGKLDKEVLSSVGFRGRQMRDIVDWPQRGETGEEKECPGEADGYVFTDHNTVVNAFHYQAVKLLSMIAGVTGRKDEAEELELYCRGFLEDFNRLLAGKDGIYADGLETGHRSLHANMLPLAFDMVPDASVKAVADYVKSRRMACSVYGALFLMDALYNAGEDDYALSLLSSTAERSWYNMIREGSTITLEAWGARYKANLDWNHAWGAVPAAVIPRNLLGVRPLEPGFAKAQIKIQPGYLKDFEAKVPTIRGTISIKYCNGRLSVSIPANMEAVLSVSGREDVLLKSGTTDNLTL